MKIAILSDIHGNILALKEVLKEIEKLNITRIYILGDIVGYYYHADQVFEYLNQFDVVFLKGNHEILLQESLQNKKTLLKITEKYGNGIKSAIEQLSKKQINHILEYPTVKVDAILDLKIAFAHGSLDDINKYIYPDTDIDILNAYSNYGYDFIFMGHTHYPFSFNGKSGVVANVGSVGQARDKGGAASWCVLDTKNQVLVFKHTLYDVEALVREVKKINPEIEYLYKILQR